MARHDIVPAHLAVQAMRDNGYKNAAYAIAELMDNSIQAEAKHVELLCGQLEIQLDQRRRWRIHELAVLDDGTGMDATRLRAALQFGNGAYLDEAKHTGIGRFGMGLPNSSVSQCKRVDVWSWQDGIASALHSYLDITEIRDGVLTEVPEPVPAEIPTVWRKVGKAFSKTGTLVVWSSIDRCMWHTANAIIENSEFLIGRMYRRFLDEGSVQIRLVAFDHANPTSISTDKFARPNDPCYLMANTSCPPPFSDTPMFEPHGNESAEAVVAIGLNGKTHEVKIRFSVAKEEARQGVNPGGLDHGKHAARNVGISIMRAGRELDLDQSLVITYSPVERWWGVELEFPPALDELFGVTNNKQAARNFSELAKSGIRSLLEPGQTITQLKQELLQDGDPRAPLLEIVNIIETRLGIMRGWLDAQRKGTRSQQRHQLHPTAEQVATEATKERQKEGHLGASDRQEDLPAEEKRGIIEKTLIDEGVTVSKARELADTTVSSGFKYVFATADLEMAAFFSVKIRGGVILISLNTGHPAYEKLIEVLEDDPTGAEVGKLQERLDNAREGLRLLLMAWARYEDEQGDGPVRMRAQAAREDWGRIAYQFLEAED